MDISNPTGPNAEQIKYWNETAGGRWATLHEVIDAHIAPLGRRAIERAAIARGERVLDIGCGCGHTTLDIARRVGPSGRVVGIDISAIMLDCARQASPVAGLGTLHFEHADAQVHAFAPGSFDLLYSRFGVMFFADPEAAFANLRAALRPGGRMTFICWRPLLENAWLLVPMMAAAQHLELKPAAPDAPGPFSLGDEERGRNLLARAGFADIQFEPADETLTVAGTSSLDSAVEFLLQIGPTASALREADPALRPRVTAAVRDALAPYGTGDCVRMAAAAWIVTASNGG